jgi:hypothetical protein
MKIDHRKLFVISATLTVFALIAMPNLAAPQAPTSLLATANGQGTLTVGKEVFKVTAVVVKLKEDGTGEITLVTDLQLFVACTWTSTDDLSKAIELKITGGTNPGTAQGSGKLFLKPDGKSIASLSMEGMSTAVKRKIKLEFVAE